MDLVKTKTKRKQNYKSHNRIYNLLRKRQGNSRITQKYIRKYNETTETSKE
jgi:hypothetical protein